MQTPRVEPDRRAFAPLVETCRDYGISRSVAFELAKSGMLDTFKLGRARYVKLDSLRTLPERIAERDKAAA